MDDWPTRLADLLEAVATRVRALTVDRAAKAIKVVSLALPILVLVSVAVVFLFMTIHGALAIPLGSAGAFGVIGGLFLVGGAFVWTRRTRSPEDES